MCVYQIKYYANIEHKKRDAHIYDKHERLQNIKTNYSTTKITNINVFLTHFAYSIIGKLAVKHIHCVIFGGYFSNNIRISLSRTNGKIVFSNIRLFNMF